MFKLAIYWCVLFVPLFLTAQPPTNSEAEAMDLAETPNRAYGLTPEETIIAETGLAKIKPDNYAYIIIHSIPANSSKTKNSFKIWELEAGKTIGAWKPLSDIALARWICNNKLYNGKTIVLVSSSNVKTTESLAKNLGKLDMEAKQPLRPVIGWDEEGIIFENGYITGGSTCTMYTPSVKNTPPTARILQDHEIPQGRLGSYPDMSCKYVILAPLSVLEQRLRDTKNDDLNNSLRELKRKSNAATLITDPYFQLYEKLVTHQGAWDAWVYLRRVQHGSHAINDFKLLTATDSIRKQYFKGTDELKFQKAFNYFFVACPTVLVEPRIRQLLPLDMSSLVTPKPVKPLTLVAFEALVAKVSKSVLLADHLAGSFEMALGSDFLKRDPKNQPLLSTEKERERHLSLLATTTPALAAFMYETQTLAAFQKLARDGLASTPVMVPVLSQKTFDAVNSALMKPYLSTLSPSRVKTILVDAARQPIVERVNEAIGLQVESIDELKRITTQYIEESASSGSIFEHWVRNQAFFKNEGKQTFYFEVINKDKKDEKRTPIDEIAWNALGNQRATLQKQLEAATKEADKKNIADALAQLPEPATRIIDCSYVNSGGALVSTPGKTCNLVCVEVKHIVGKLEGETLKQFRDNVNLVKTERMVRIEYIFSTKDAAIKNISVFNENFTQANAKGNSFQVYYINDNGAKDILSF